MTVLSMKVRNSTSSNVARPSRRRILPKRTAISGAAPEEGETTAAFSAGIESTASRVRETTRAIGPLPLAVRWNIRRTSQVCTQKVADPSRRPTLVGCTQPMGTSSFRQAIPAEGMARPLFR